MEEKTIIGVVVELNPGTSFAVLPFGGNQRKIFQLTNGNLTHFQRANPQLGQQATIKYEKVGGKIKELSVEGPEYSIDAFEVEVLSVDGESKVNVRYEGVAGTSQFDINLLKDWKVPQPGTRIKIFSRVKSEKEQEMIGWELAPRPEGSRPAPPPPPAAPPPALPPIEEVEPPPAAVESPPEPKSAQPEPGLKTGLVMSITPAEGQFPASINLAGVGEILYLGSDPLPEVGQQIELEAGLDGEKGVLFCQSWKPISPQVSDSKPKLEWAKAQARLAAIWQLVLTWLPDLRSRIQAAWAARPKWRLSRPSWPKLKLPAWPSKAKQQPKPPATPTSDSKPKRDWLAIWIVFVIFIAACGALFTSFEFGRFAQQANEAELAQQVESLQNQLKNQTEQIGKLETDLGAANTELETLRGDKQTHRQEIDGLTAQLKAEEEGRAEDQEKMVTAACELLKPAIEQKIITPRDPQRKIESCGSFFRRKLGDAVK